MWESTHLIFDELAEKCGNRYLAVMYISKLSRKLNYQVPGGALASQLITWALTGNKPEFKYNVLYHKNISPDLATMESYLEYVTDEDIKASVRISYTLSIRKHHLIYVYDKSLDQYQQGRMRVLLRMIWSENFELKENDVYA